MSKSMSTASKLLIAYWILTVLPLVIVFASFPWLPESDIVLRFDITGQPDRLGSKWSYLAETFVIVALSIGIFIATRLYAKDSKDPVKNETISLMIILGMLVIFNALVLWGMFWNIDQLHAIVADMNISIFIYVYIGIYMIFIGIIITKLTSDLMFGSRVPWNLSVKAWICLQYFTRWTLIVAGVIVIIMGVFFSHYQITSIILFLFMASICLIILAYGFMLRNQNNDN